MGFVDLLDGDDLDIGDVALAAAYASVLYIKLSSYWLPCQRSAISNQPRT
jgi:hypothetical protein